MKIITGGTGTLHILPTLPYRQPRFGGFTVDVAMQKTGSKELKFDFGFDSFNMQSFFGTEAALIFAMLAYNLMALFRQFLLNSKVQNILSTLRHKTFAIGVYFQKTNNRYTLKLSLNLKRREWFEGLWNHSTQVNLPFKFSNA